MDKFIGTVQRFIFQITFYHIFWVLLQPPPPHSSIDSFIEGYGHWKLKVVVLRLGRVCAAAAKFKLFSNNIAVVAAVPLSKQI